MQLGFVIDHSKCIGCHACTVACKAENDVPLGNFRTWVKYTEEGTFPQVRRSFAVLRCNQCSQAPCITICPVKALSRRADGIVDVDPAACIGCKACMQACPYDALYLNESKGTAEKCHFCAHRTELGLAPACAVVCPTEAIIPGDFHDPTSAVSRLRAAGDLSVRKPEAGTGPNVFYRQVSEPGIDPQLTSAGGGYLWAQRLPGPTLAAEQFEAAERQARARTTYDVDHPMHWGWKVSSYLFTKSLAAGIFLALALGDRSIFHSLDLTLFPLGRKIDLSPFPLAALFFLALTGLLLVSDLKRPARFAYILLRPNLSSWLTRGSLVLLGYGLLLLFYSVPSWTRSLPGPAAGALLASCAVLAALTAGYTGWLFAQSKGRVLWMRRGLWLHLIVQALVAGYAFLLLCAGWLDPQAGSLPVLRTALAAALVVHGLFVLTEHLCAPRGREAEYARATRLITRGPFARRRYTLGLAAGLGLPLVLLAVWSSPVIAAIAGALALLGLWVEEDILVRAGQSPAIS